MKTNNVLELLKAKGLGLDKNTSNATALLPQIQISKKKRLYQTIQNDTQFDQVYENPPSKPTENLRKTYGKPTEELHGQYTENLRKTYGRKNVLDSKPTDTPTDDSTDNIRKTYGKPTDVNLLVGFQKMIFFWLISQAKELGFYDNEGNRITPPINGNIIALSTFRKAYKQVKDIIYELKVSGYIQNYKIKNGRGGFTQYRIKKDIYQSCLLTEAMSKPTDNIRKTYGKPTGKPTDTPTDESSSSSSLINNTTTTKSANFEIEENGNSSLPPEWNEIDITCLEEIGFSKRFLIQLYKKSSITPEVLQDSIYAYAFDLKKNDKLKGMKKSPLEYFMGIVGKGNPYLPPQNYESPRDEAMRLYLERKQQLEKERQEREEKAKEFAFQDWLKGIPEEERQKLLPEFARGLPFGEAAKSALKNHFLENVWENNFTEIVKVLEKFPSEID